MLKRIVMQLSGRLTALCTQVLAWLTTRLWNPASSLLVSSTRVFLSAINRLNPHVRMVLNFKAWAASLTTAAQSTKQGRSTAKAKATQIGSQLQITVHLILQRVLRLQSLSKKRAEKTKLVQSLLKKAVAVLTRMVYLLKVIGLKQVGTVRQPQQRAQRQRSKGH